jgi:hypothetical protein
MEGAGVSTWTDERVAELRRLCETEMSYTAMGAAMGLTRNTVISKAKRLKIERPVIVYQRHNGGGWKRRREQVHPTYHINVRPTTVEPVNLGPLPSGGCLFPMWGNERPTHVYCGEQRKGDRPYCIEHCATAYLPLRVTQHVNPLPLDFKKSAHIKRVALQQERAT